MFLPEIELFDDDFHIGIYTSFLKYSTCSFFSKTEQLRRFTEFDRIISQTQTNTSVGKYAGREQQNEEAVTEGVP